jgi:hypothetical protein
MNEGKKEVRFLKKVNQKNVGLSGPRELPPPRSQTIKSLFASISSKKEVLTSFLFSDASMLD